MGPCVGRQSYDDYQKNILQAREILKGNTRQVLNELKEEYHFTYIFISHDLSVVRFMSDRIVVMQNGRIVEMGDADDICDRPQTEYTQKLLSAIPKGILNE